MDFSALFERLVSKGEYKVLGAVFSSSQIQPIPQRNSALPVTSEYLHPTLWMSHKYKGMTGHGFSLYTASPIQLWAVEKIWHHISDTQTLLQVWALHLVHNFLSAARPTHYLPSVCKWHLELIKKVHPVNKPNCSIRKNKRMGAFTGSTIKAIYTFVISYIQ